MFKKISNGREEERKTHYRERVGDSYARPRARARDTQSARPVLVNNAEKKEYKKRRKVHIHAAPKLSPPHPPWPSVVLYSLQEREKEYREL